jgi:hypothetical protein
VPATAILVIVYFLVPGHQITAWPHQCPNRACVARLQALADRDPNVAGFVAFQPGDGNVGARKGVHPFLIDRWKL